jgi:hypothetical protein
MSLVSLGFLGRLVSHKNIRWKDLVYGCEDEVVTLPILQATLLCVIRILTYIH